MPKYQTQITSQQRRWSYTNTQFIKKKKKENLQKKMVQIAEARQQI